MIFDHKLFGLVVEDGSRFCHWGGRRLSRAIANVAKIQAHDCVLDLCCGEGGLTDYLGAAQAVVGVDVSLAAVRAAEESVLHPKVNFVAADARQLPFERHTFTKVVSQDADVLMHKEKDVFMSEAARVMAPSAAFIWQGYARTTPAVSVRECAALEAVGYDVCHMPYVPEMPALFLRHKLTPLRVSSLHGIYAMDTSRMRRRAQWLARQYPSMPGVPELNTLFELEEELFSSGIWTGMAVVAVKT